VSTGVIFDFEFALELLDLMWGGGKTRPYQSIMPRFVAWPRCEFEVAHVASKGGGEREVSWLESKGAAAFKGSKVSLHTVEEGDVLCRNTPEFLKLCPNRGYLLPGGDLAVTH
jgi:hypothetical protein